MKGGYYSAIEQTANLELDADTVIVGSGASGAVLAMELALTGERVIVLEEGPHIQASEHGAMRPSESLRHLWRDGGLSVAMGLGDTPSINVTMGRCVGGSSAITGGVCFRIPEPVLREWVQVQGLSDYSVRAMEPFFERVEQAMHVETVPIEQQSRSTKLFGNGAAQLGFPIKPMRRNTHGCKGCGQCNFGCPHEAKRSVDLSYLPRAVQAGASVWSHCRVERILTKGTRAIGVTGRYPKTDQGKSGGSFSVYAKRVVVAGGAWMTPLLLRRSGIARRSHDLGRNLTLHPAFRVLARFRDPVRGWEGALQSAFSDHFELEGITLMSVFVPVGVIAATMPGVGPSHVSRARQIGHMAMFGGIIHDEGGGTIHRSPSGTPWVTYRMAPKDRPKIAQIVRIMSKAFLAAGAEEIYPPILGLKQGYTADGINHLDLESLPGRRFECSSQHPLGSARMGTDARHSVVNPDGRVWNFDNVYIVDGSILPTSLGVNPQLAIMAVATKLASRMIEKKVKIV